MARKKKEKKDEAIKNEKKPEKKKRERKKRQRKKKPQELSEELKKGKKEIELNVYNLLFDEINLFLNELQHLSMKALKQRLVLLDGKLLWVEKHSEDEIDLEEEKDDIVDLEMEMLELGLDLDDAEDSSMNYMATAEDFDISAIKADLIETKSFGDNLKDLLKEIEEDGVEKPIEEMLSKFILYDLRASLERAINSVFKLEGQVKKLTGQEGAAKKLQNIINEQKKITKSTLKDLLAKLKKEKPKLIMEEEKINEFKKLSQKKVVDMKAKEEQEFDTMVEDLLNQE
ncbi:MAG: hypothetical protein ACTSO7_13145 [Candidatus Heimdallarchaeota archaeon]